MSEPPDRVRELLERLAAEMDVEADVSVSEDAEEILARYDGPDLEPLIGPHGQTIDAIQHLAVRMAFRGTAARKRVSVDAGDYRSRRLAALEAAADQAVDSVARSGRPEVLEPMTASERRVVHEYLKNRHEVETYSQGQEPDRRLVVAPVTAAP